MEILLTLTRVSSEVSDAHTKSKIPRNLSVILAHSEIRSRNAIPALQPSTIDSTLT